MHSNSRITNNRMQLINQHFQHINILAEIIQNSQQLLLNNNFNQRQNQNTYFNQRQNQNGYFNTRRNQTSSFNTRRNQNNNSYSNLSNLFDSMNLNYNENNEDNSYILRFNAILPSLFLSDNSLNNIDYSYNYFVIDNSNSLQEQIEDVSSTIDLFDIEKFEYITEPINDICPITRDRFYNNQEVIMIKKCKHIFNKSSLKLWLTNHNTCPSCRINIK